MESEFLKTLSKLRKETPRRFADLRTRIDAVVTELGDPNRQADDDGSEVVAFFEPFRLCCESRQPRLIEISLEGAHFLIKFGYFEKLDESNKDVNKDSNSGGGGSSANNASAGGKSIMEKYIDLICSCVLEQDDTLNSQVVVILLTAISTLKCQVHEGSILSVVRAYFSIYTTSKSSQVKMAAKNALLQIVSVLNQRMESHEEQVSNFQISGATTITIDSTDSKTDVVNENKIMLQMPADSQRDSTNAATDEASFSFMSIYHKDAYLIFRALCKLSMQSLSDESGNPLDFALLNKVLSLELIVYILQNCGASFKTGEHFIFAVRNYLCVSLLNNCTSQIGQVFGLSMQIFLLLLEHFKVHLKSEVEVFVTNIFVPILESENSSNEQKQKVLAAFQTICRDNSGLVEMFINYDCDMEGIDLFKKIVDGFAKVTKPSSNEASKRSSLTVAYLESAKKALEEERQVRTMGVEGLVIILQSILKSAGLEEGKNDDATVDASKVNRHSLSPVKVNPDKSDSEQSQGGLEDKNKEKEKEKEKDSKEQGTDVAAHVEVFDKKQKQQEDLETGILKCNLSFKKGLSYLESAGLIEMTPYSVAVFLWQYKERLDKSAIGDFLGREREYENGFCLKVLHEYACTMNFEKLPFDLAIRQFLSGFRLPGEAQKIDRIMEKFAERFYLQNRDVFASADQAFILAFSTIMLQTNLHNPAIKDEKRMTKDQFLKQNKGISSDGEIPEQLLMDIYDRIAIEPITLKDKEDSQILRKNKQKEEASILSSLSAGRRKKEAFDDERKELVKTGESMMKQRRKSTYVKKLQRTDELYIKPMFEVVWAPILGVFSQVLELSESFGAGVPAAVTSCLQGFKNAIRLACRLDLPVIRDSYINALVKFSALDAMKEMQVKNTECIKALLAIAISEKYFIEESWNQILQLISQLSRLMSFSSNGDNAIGSVAEVKKKDAFSDFSKFFSGPDRAEKAKILDEVNSELVKNEINPATVDQIFFNSQYLSEECVLIFVKALCIVSEKEINAASAGMNAMRVREDDAPKVPRIYSLGKLVEVADFNMECRPRLAWANMWKLLTDLFLTIGTHENSTLAMYAVDSLKQLSVKFLQKEELSNFNFQRLFLKPFEVIILRSKSLQIKDMVLNCIDIMIRTCAPNIRSGWKSIFTIFEVTAHQTRTELANAAFNILGSLMESHFHLLIYDFFDLLNCLNVFINSGHTDISVKAIFLMSVCAENLGTGKLAPAITQSSNNNDALTISWTNSDNGQHGGGNLSGGTGGVVNGSIAASGATSPSTSLLQSGVEQFVISEMDDAAMFRFWWPLMVHLSRTVADNRPVIRSQALKMLNSILNAYGGLFSIVTWPVVFKGVLFPMIDNAKNDIAMLPASKCPAESPSAPINIESWISSMSLSVLNLYKSLYFTYRSKGDACNILPDILSIVERCACQSEEILAKIGLDALYNISSTIIQLAQQQAVGNQSSSSSSSDCKVVEVAPDVCSLICLHMSRVMLRNLPTKFGELGELDFSPEIPDNIETMLNAHNEQEADLVRIPTTSDFDNGIEMTNYSDSSSNNSSNNNNKNNKGNIESQGGDDVGSIGGSSILPSAAAGESSLVVAHVDSVGDGSAQLVTAISSAVEASFSTSSLAPTQTSTADTTVTNHLEVAEEMSIIGRQYATPYGSGSILCELPSDAGPLNLPPRYCVELPWGKIYFPSPNPTSTSNSTSTSSQLGGDLQISTHSAVTSDNLLDFGDNSDDFGDFASSSPFNENSNVSANTLVVEKGESSSIDDDNSSPLAFDKGGDGGAGGSSGDYDYSEPSSPASSPIAASHPSSAATAAINLFDHAKAVSTMTSMVISLNSIDVITKTVKSYSSLLSVDNLVSMLAALESSYWHARSFNECIEVRQALGEKRFMKFANSSYRDPHLLEQEVFSLSAILDISIDLYLRYKSSDHNQLGLLWAHRFIRLTCEMYVKLEKVLASSSASAFDIDRHESYGPATLIALKGLKAFNTSQFLLFYPEFVNSFSSLIRCDDIDIRNCLSDIHDAHMSPLILSLRHDKE